jgi:primosomal protein N' (replication factor Y)
MKILRVALALPVPQLFDYRCDSAGDDDIGRRVVVPFGTSQVAGIVLEISNDSQIEPQRLRHAVAILHDMPALTQEWLGLARFASDYYQRSLGEVIHAALPPRLRLPRPVRVLPTAYAITAAGRSAMETLSRRSRPRLAALERLTQGPCAADELPAQIARALAKAGWIAPATPRRAEPIFVDPLPLTRAQLAAVAAVRDALTRYAPFLLLGITGSGKTEVYLHLIAAALARGRSALVLVPEINLTPPLAQELARRFSGARIVTLTSALAADDRARAWLAIQGGAAHIVLGTRLAVFAPLPDLGLVIVDEEHDTSFKQQEGVRYSARDLAVFRAHGAGVPVVLGSATPSLESYSHALDERYSLIELTERARVGAALPSVAMIDLSTTPAPDGIAAPLAEAISARLARGEQSLLFLNRRGFAPVLACGACGWTSDCSRCAAHLVVHLAARQLRCHHCGFTQPVPRACPTCGNVDLVPFGRGTQRLEEAIARRFPAARVLRIDSDSTRRRGTWEDMLASIRAGDADILVGTQILAKGHDFPQLTLVGVLNADAALVAADYRAPERLFAQLMQVAGRAGRAEAPGQVLVQTRYPQHPLYQAVAAHDYRGFAERLLQERREAGFPPFVYEACLRAESRILARATDFLAQAVQAAPHAPEELHVFDPVPMSLARVGGWERAHVLLQSESRRSLQTFLKAWSPALYSLKTSSVRWHIDVDPLEF